MKNILYLILFFNQVFFAQSGFEKGNSLYQKGNYQEAIVAYESVLKTNKQSAELYFNLGNCYYKLNKVAPAIYNFEKALLLHPDEVEMLNNLKFAQKLQIDEVKEVPRVGFDKLIQDFTAMYAYNTWAWIAVGLATLFLLLFVGYYFSARTSFKRLFFFGMFLAIFFLLLSVLSAVFEKRHYENHQPAIVYAEIAPVKAEPKTEAPDTFVLHEGTKVFIQEKLDHWTKIQLSDGTDGWIEQVNIKPLK